MLLLFLCISYFGSIYIYIYASLTTAVFVSDFQIFVSLGDYCFLTDISFQICKVQNEVLSWELYACNAIL